MDSSTTSLLWSSFAANRLMSPSMASHLPTQVSHLSESHRAYLGTAPGHHHTLALLLKAAMHICNTLKGLGDAAVLCSSSCWCVAAHLWGSRCA